MWERVRVLFLTESAPESAPESDWERVCVGVCVLKRACESVVLKSA